MKTLTLINWIIIGIYGVLALAIYLDTNRSGIDAAGRGMAMGFLFVGLVYLAVLIGLNLIAVRWVRLLVLLLGGLPLLAYAGRALSSWQNQKEYARLSKANAHFENPHLDAMRQAVGDQNVQALESLLAQDDSHVNHIGATNQRTLLGIAVQNASFEEQPAAREVVHLLLRHGADPNVYHPGRHAPLAQHGTYSSLAVFRALLEAGADPNVRGEHAVPLLYTLTERGRDDAYEKVALLLEHGLDPDLPLGTDQPYQLNYSPLVWAAHHEQWAICQLLVDSGADVHFQPAGPDGRTFWQILEAHESRYRAAGSVPAGFEDLLSHEVVKNGRPV